MPVVRNFLTEAVTAVRQKVDHWSESALPEGREVDSSYREQAEHNLRQSEKHFMWGKASEILTMMMSAVLMGGVTGTIIAAVKGAGAIGMLGLGGAGLVLAVAAVGAAYVSFKSSGKTDIHKIETNADLYARTNAVALAPAISQTVGQEVKAAFKDAIKELHAEQQQAMIAGAANTNGSVPAAVAELPAVHTVREVATREPTIHIMSHTPEVSALPASRIHGEPEIMYGGKAMQEQKTLEAATARQ